MENWVACFFLNICNIKGFYFSAIFHLRLLQCEPWLTDLVRTRFRDMLRYMQFIRQSRQSGRGPVAAFGDIWIMFVAQLPKYYLSGREQSGHTHSVMKSQFLWSKFCDLSSP